MFKGFKDQIVLIDTVNYSIMETVDLFCTVLNLSGFLADRNPQTTT